MIYLTEDKITEIARKFARTMGDHWCSEYGIPEDYFEDFAIAIETEVLSRIHEEETFVP